MSLRWHIQKAALLPSFSLLFAQLSITPQVCTISSSLSSPPLCQMLEIPEPQWPMQPYFFPLLWKDLSAMRPFTLWVSCTTLSLNLAPKAKLPFFWVSLWCLLLKCQAHHKYSLPHGWVGNGQCQESTVLMDSDHLRCDACDLIHVIFFPQNKEGRITHMCHAQQNLGSTCRARCCCKLTPS